ncbi:hypothetical protein ABVV53_12165 [Novosphingobium sp. RD2P27]|uniref:Uncharacterized protein n=1 Tax=Novosphingobium kalidii TaxID=3230299 RepID=A0ABV2D2V1_9SPHN
MLEPAGTGQPFPRAFLRIGGASLAQHQLGLVLGLECQRLICLARGPSPELIALQHAAEGAGLRFHIVPGPQQLSALVTATDELIVVTEGLFADWSRAATLLNSGGPSVVALPDDGAVAEGFERLDINHAAAGVMKISGALVDRLHDLPSDCDVVSALTRIALQSGTPMRQVPPDTRRGVNWRMVRSEGEALAIEVEWLRARLVIGSSAAPSDRLARAGVLSFGSSLLHAGNASGAVGAGALLVLALAFGTAWLGSPVLAFVFIALAWVLARATELLRSAEREAHNVSTPAIPRAHALGWLVDISIVAVCALGLAAPPGWPAVDIEYRIFAPLMLVLMLHLAPRLLADGFAAWTGDRALLGLLLAVAAALDHLGIAVRLLAVVLAVAAIVLPPRRLN